MYITYLTKSQSKQFIANYVNVYYNYKQYSIWKISVVITNLIWYYHFDKQPIIQFNDEHKNQVIVIKNMFINSIKSLYTKWKSSQDNIVEFPAKCTNYSLMANTQFYGAWLCEDNEPKYILKPDFDLRIPPLFIINLGTWTFNFEISMTLQSKTKTDIPYIAFKITYLLTDTTKFAFTMKHIERLSITFNPCMVDDDFVGGITHVIEINSANKYVQAICGMDSCTIEVTKFIKELEINYYRFNQLFCIVIDYEDNKTFKIPYYQ